MSLCVSSGTLPEEHPKRASLEHTSYNQFVVLRLERARPRYSSVFDIRAKITFNNMTAELPEIRLVKLLTITLTEKYTDDATLCWSNIYCLLQKSSSVTTKMLLKLFSTIVRRKNKLMISLLFLNFIFHQNLIMSTA